MSALDDFRPGAVASPKRKRTAAEMWEPPTNDNLVDGNLLCFDPSLSATGFAALRCRGGHIHVHEARTMKGTCAPGLTGWEAAMAQAEDLQDQFVALLQGYLDWGVVVEQPPMGGGQVRSPESAILVCAAVRNAARLTGFHLLPMQSPQRHRKATVGNSQIKKPEHHKLLMQLAVSLGIGGIEKITNGATRDALSVGISALRREGA